MIHLQHHIQEVFKKILLEAEEEMRDPSDQFLYEVSLYNTRIDSDIHKEIPLDNSYLNKSKRIIPIVIQGIEGDFTNLPNVTVLEGSLVASLFIPVESNDMNNNEILERFENISKTFDKMRQNNLGKAIPLGDIRTIITEDYRLITTYGSSAVSEIDINVIFNDVSKGVLFRDRFEVTNTFNIYLDDGDLKVNYPRNTEKLSVPVEKDTQYNIQTLVDGDEYVLLINSEEEGRFEITEAMSDSAGFEFKDFFGEVKYYSFKLDNEEVFIDNLYDDGSITNLGVQWTITNRDNSVVIGEHGYVSFEFTLPNPITGQVTFENGINYQEFLVEMGITVNGDVFSGSQVRYFIDDIELYPLTRNHAYTTDVDQDFKVSEFTSKGIIIDNAFLHALTLYYQPIPKVIQLIKHITNPQVEQNKVFKFKVIFPLFTREYDVLVKMGGTEPIAVNPITFSIELELADDEIKGEE